jgi:hypothetical protein
MIKTLACAVQDSKLENTVDCRLHCKNPFFLSILKLGCRGDFHDRGELTM